MKLIDKDALVAEIERRKNFHSTPNAYSRLYEDYAILSFINTLEVKEVDLEEEIECSLPKPAWGWNEDYFGKSDPAYSMEQMKEFAKHFFELGLKAQKGEKV